MNIDCSEEVSKGHVFRETELKGENAVFGVIFIGFFLLVVVVAFEVCFGRLAH